jgi:hypothetical protein
MLWKKKFRLQEVVGRLYLDGVQSCFVRLDHGPEL